jgi:predicted Zn-dependent protease
MTYPVTEQPRRQKTKIVRAGHTSASSVRGGLIFLAVIVGFALGLLVLGVGPKLVSKWKESRWLRQAETALKQGNFNVANEAARQALEINRDSLSACEILAETTEKQNRAETVGWRAQIARLRPGDIASQLNLASAALRFGQLDVARKALESVPKENRESASYHVVAGWLARAQGDEANQERHFAAALEKEPGNETYQYNLAALRIKLSDPQKQAQARAILERLAKSAPFRAGSLRALLNDAIRQSNLEAADRFAQELQLSPQVTFSDDLLCLDFYKKLDKKKLTTLLDKVKPLAARQPDDLAALMEWMNANGMSADVLRWMEKLPPEKTANPPAAIEVADAFSVQKNWARLRRWTKGGEWGESEYLRIAYQAYARQQSRQDGTETESLWHDAERACEENPEREIRLARLASKWNLPAQAEQLWLRVAHNPLSRREALDSLFAIYRANNDLPNLYLTAMRLHETSPDEPLIAAEYARLSLLLDRNRDEGRRAAKEAFDQAPTEPPCAVAQALFLNLDGRTADGIAILQKLPAEKLHDPRLALYLAVLLLNGGKAEAAREFIDEANSGFVFPEEKELLEEALQKHPPAAAPPGSPAPSAVPSPAAMSASASRCEEDLSSRAIQAKDLTNSRKMVQFLKDPSLR